VRVLALKLVFTLLPATVIVDLRTPFWVVEVSIRRTAEILLSMGIVAFAPFVFLIDTRTERSFVAVKHELLKRQLTIQQIQILRKPTVLHEVTDYLALLCSVRKRVVLLFLFV
jgi:hypothetical protein